MSAPPEQSSKAQAAPGDGHHPTAGLSDAKTVGKGMHPGTSDIPAPGNTKLGAGGPTSMSDSHNSHPGSGSTPASGLDGKAGDPEPNAHKSAEQPELKETKEAQGKDVKKTPEEANASGDGTFGDGKFDAKAPGAAAVAQKLEGKARQEAGEEGKINVPVN